MSFVISNGPFQGVVPAASELEVQQNDRGPITIWGTHHRTRVFLGVFSPVDGWSIDVNVKDPGISMQDHYTRDGHDQPTIQPTREFEAILTNPEGRVVAKASVLKIINSEFAWKAGITSARNALYEALGLPSCVDGSAEAEEAAPENRAAPIVTVSGTTEADSVVQGIEDTGESFSVEAVGESEDTFVPPAVIQANAEDEATQAAPDSDTVDSATPAASDASTPSGASRPKSPQASVEERQERAIAAKRKTAVNGVPVGIKNRIAKLYKEAGLEVPTYNGLEEATQVLHQIVEGTVGKNGTAVQGSLT